MVIKDRENIFQKKFARLKKVRTFAARLRDYNEVKCKNRNQQIIVI